MLLGEGYDSSLINIQAFLILSHTYFLTNLVRKEVLLVGKSWFHFDSYHKRGKTTQKKVKTAGKEELNLAGSFMACWVQCSVLSLLILYSFPGLSLLSWNSFGTQCSHFIWGLSVYKWNGFCNPTNELSFHFTYLWSLKRKCIIGNL